jgi:hypothetical protein
MKVRMEASGSKEAEQKEKELDVEEPRQAPSAA